MSIRSLVNTNKKLSTVSEKQQHSILFLGHESKSSALPALFCIEGYHVHNQLNDEDIVTSINKYSPSLVILELGVSSAQKLNAIATIRSLYQGALMIVSTSSSEQNEVLAFNLGADEFLVKPVSNAITLCRAQALLRQSEQACIITPDKISIGDIALFPQSQKCQVNNQDVPLTFFEFKLLMLLAENAGKVMSRDDIYLSLLSRAYNGVERTVDVRMSQLRDKLSSEGIRNGAIETVWGQGYMFNVAA